MSVWYNDNDPFVCAWLRNLIAAKLIPDGVVDERPIQEVEPADLRGFTQCHFFAGIGGWAYALELAGWGDRPVWTGSCPCQPGSAAGKRQGHRDPRHLWPEWLRLIAECRPHTVFGEQVSGFIGLGWLDAVSTDLEAEGYAVGPCVLGAHSVGAPHLRQRLWFVADRDCPRCGTGRAGETRAWSDTPRIELAGLRAAGGMGNPELYGSSAVRQLAKPEIQGRLRELEGSSAVGELADAESGNGRLSISGRGSREDSPKSERGGETSRMADTQEPRDNQDASRRTWWDTSQPYLGSSPWNCEWLPCRDGKARPTQPGLQPLAHGIPSRVGRLRAYGNAIVPQVAAAFVKAYMEVCP